jgi:hypothetical protein
MDGGIDGNVCLAEISFIACHYGVYTGMAGRCIQSAKGFLSMRTSRTILASNNSFMKLFLKIFPVILFINVYFLEKSAKRCRYGRCSSLFDEVFIKAILIA